MTPNERFYVRTRVPDRIDLTKPWIVHVDDRAVDAAEIAARARPRA